MCIEVAFSSLVQQPDVFASSASPVTQRKVFVCGFQAERILRALDQPSDPRRMHSTPIAQVLPEFAARVERVDMQFGKRTEARENADESKARISDPEHMQPRGQKLAQSPVVDRIERVRQ